MEESSQRPPVVPSDPLPPESRPRMTMYVPPSGIGGSSNTPAAAIPQPNMSEPHTSAKNMSTARKVSKLLDITINNTLRDLVVYVDEAVPSFFDPSLAPAATTAGEVAEAAGAAAAAAIHAPGGAQKRGMSSPQTTQPAVAAVGAAGPSSSATSTAAGLRTALEGRVTDMHKDFLSQFRVLYDSFRDVAQHVQSLNEECTSMERALGISRDGQAAPAARDGGPPHNEADGVGDSGKRSASAAAPALSSSSNSFAETEVLVRRVNGLQRELQNAQRRQRDIKDFKEKYNFGAAEQKILEDGQVDTRYLDVLEQARAVHRQSRSLLLSREYQQSAGAVIESTYNAIMRATEKISRFLLALSSPSSTHGGGGGGGSGAAAGGTSGQRHGGRMGDGSGMISSVSADVPEVSSLFLRCANVLREENVSQWEKVMEELSRARRASVLRRYFHLLTTGSTTTSAGTYRAGGAMKHDDGSATGSQRPLEAELNNPVFFFSSLFAWLHQSIVEEEDFLNLFFASPAAAASRSVAATANRDEAQDGGGGGLALATATTPTQQRTTLSKRALLRFIFDGVTKHLRTAFDSVLERFVKASAVLGHTIVTSPSLHAAGEADGGDGVGSGGAAAALPPGGGNGDVSIKLGLTQQQARAPRGLTGGLSRLLYAATGRHIGLSGSGGNGVGGSGTGSSNNSILQRYSSVSSREQQETVASSLMRGPLTGLHVCYQLLQLFAYYGAATFLPLLGAKASLTVLVVESANVELQRVLQQLVKFISLHLFDSVGGVVNRLPVLRRLSSAYESSLQVYHAQEKAAASTGSGRNAAVGGGVDGTAQQKKPTTTLAAASSGGSVAKEGDTPAKGSPPPSRFVLDFLFKHYALLMESHDDSSNFASRSEAAGGSGGGALSYGGGPGTAGGGGSGSTDPQQQASALELARSLQHLILPATPEVVVMLKLLRQLLDDTARQQQMLAAIKEQHKQLRAQQQQQQQQGKDGQVGRESGVTGDDQKDAEEAEMESREGEEQIMYAMTVVQSLLSLPVLLSAQTVASRGLDDPCKLVLELNCFYALRAVLEEHRTLLPSPSTLHATQQREIDKTSKEKGGQTTSALVSIVDSEIVRLEDTLGSHLAAAAAAHYFRQARLPPSLLSSSVAMAGVAEEATPTDREAALRHNQKQQAIRTSLFWLYNLYNLIASSGSLPTLPLVANLSSADAQSRLHKRVTQHVVDEYAVIYREVEAQLTAEAAGALLSVEETTAFADMKPSKLAILMDK